MICPKCSKNAGDAKFCPECGEKLISENTKPKNDSVENEGDHDPKAETQDFVSAEDQTTEADQADQQSGKRKKLFIITAAVAVVIAAVIVIVCFSSRKIDVEKELFNSFWIQQDSKNPITLNFSGGGVTLVDANKQTINLAWELKGENTVQLNYTFFGTYPYMTLEMTREHGKPVMKYIHNADGKTLEVVFHKSTSTQEAKQAPETTETTTEETTTEKSYPPAEEFNAYDVSFYEKDNEVKRQKYLEEIYKKRFVFYLEVSEVEGKREISGSLYPNENFYLDKTKGQKIYSTLYNSYRFPADMTKDDYITYLYYSCNLTFVDFDEEIWETLEKGSKVVIEASIDAGSSITDLDYIGFSLKLKNAVIVSKK